MEGGGNGLWSIGLTRGTLALFLLGAFRRNRPVQGMSGLVNDGEGLQLTKGGLTLHYIRPELSPVSLWWHHELGTVHGSEVLGHTSA